MNHQTESQFLFNLLIFPLIVLTVITTFTYRSSAELGWIF